MNHEGTDFVAWLQGAIARHGIEPLLAPRWVERVPRRTGLYGENQRRWQRARLLGILASPWTQHTGRTSAEQEREIEEKQREARLSDGWELNTAQEICEAWHEQTQAATGFAAVIPSPRRPLAKTGSNTHTAGVEWRAAGANAPKVCGNDRRSRSLKHLDRGGTWLGSRIRRLGRPNIGWRTASASQTNSGPKRSTRY